MELCEKDKFDTDKVEGDPLNYHSSSISSNWQFGAANHSNQPMGIEALTDSIVEGNGFLQTTGEVMPRNLSEFPADSDIIERAARFSCFSDIVNSFNIPVSMKPNDRSSIDIPFEVQSVNGLKAKLGVHSHINEQNMTEGSHDVKRSVERRAAEGCSKEGVVGYVKAHDDTSKESSLPFEANVSGSRPQVEPSMLEGRGIPSESNGHTVKKRKRINQVIETDRTGRAPQLKGETTKDDKEHKQKNVQNPTTTSKATKHGKHSSQNSDAAKEDYIHVRARRGQATNSHSLAERVRREKISERMKFLQDLVPGCNKVTGKAVMLDEIINYVQSLQRQVEFLSMKLATVNPRLDLNIEGLLAKDVHQSRGGPLIFPFPPDANMVRAQLHPSQQVMIQAGIPGTGDPLDALRRPINSQLVAMNGIEYKDSSQVPNMWDDELNNVFPMNFGTSDPFNGQDLNGSLPSDPMKAEP